MENIITEIIRLLGPAVWVLPALYLFFLYQRRRDRDRYEMERMMKREELERQEYLSHKMSREYDKEVRYSPKIQEELIYRLDRLEKRITSNNVLPQNLELSTRLDSILDAVTQSQNETADTPVQLIRELSHSLNTPLSQIEVSASVALSTLDNRTELEKSIHSISDSVRVCKAFLGAFRELVVSGPAAAVWNPNSIEEAVKSATQIYASSKNKELTFKLDLPTVIEGYSNNYISALILPILENAVESSKQGTQIIIEYSQTEGVNNINVTNEPDSEPGGDEIYGQGFTTKEGHEGTGLTSVKHLLSAIRGANLDHKFESRLATFTISLPRRMK